jgi:uncharacterized protein (DUF1499 family)
MARTNHKNTGLTNGKLNPCPDLYNCVCSQYPQDKRFFMTPWRYTNSHESAMKILEAVLKEYDGCTIKDVKNHYLHAEFKVPVFQFIDDLELYLPEEESVIHFRCASRLGTWDLGVNKARVNKLKKQFAEKGLQLT